MSSNNTPARRDKFAALAQRQQHQSQHGGEEEMQPRNETPVLPAAQQSQQQSISVATPVAAKRDKFAAMAARTGHASDGTSGGGQPEVTGGSAATTGGEGTPMTSPHHPAAARRDKFAAMGQRMEAMATSAAAGPGKLGGGKLAAMAAAAAAKGGRSEEEEREAHRKAEEASAAARDTAEAERRKQRAEWRKRVEQREAVWKDLEMAEAATLQLLDYAQQTAKALADATTSADGLRSRGGGGDDEDDDETKRDGVRDLSRLSAEYRDRLAEIHKRLAPHAELVKAYKAPDRINRMYQARVEWCVAEEKRSLLREFIRLEQQEREISDGGEGMKESDMNEPSSR